MNFMLLTASVDASKDLFNQAWTEGNLYSINGIVEKLGTFSCWVISIVGFGIVIFSILKNAMSGLYVVNPSFWDKVDDVKTQAVSGVDGAIQQAAGKGNAAVQKLGGILVFLLGLIPNIKQLTDFDDGVPVDKKQYFMKSIPLLVAQIFIGMLIFFGYPAKIANWIGSGATYALSAVINNIDPVQVVSKVSDSFTVYNLQTDGSQDPWEQNINKMASEMTSTMATKYNDMDKSNVQNVAYVIEQRLLSAFDNDNIKTVLGANEGYVYSINATIQTSPAQVSSSYKDIGNGVYQAQATNGTFSYKFWVQSSSVLTGQHTTMLGADDYMVWSITATPVAVANISSANLIICGGIGNVPTVSSGAFTLPIQGITVGDQTTDVKGTLGRVVTVSAVSNDTTVTETFNATLQTASVQNTSGAQPLLSFSSSDRERLTTALNSCAYLKVSLVGDWSKTVAGSDGKSTTTVRVTEFRLVRGANSVSYLLSTWADLDANGVATTAGVSTLSTETLKQSTISGKAE